MFNYFTLKVRGIKFNHITHNFSSMKCNLYHQMYFVCLTMALLSCLILYQVYLIQINKKSYNSDAPIILWWTPFGSDDKLRHCGDSQCYFTSNRSFQNHNNIKSFLFYGSNFQIYDLPKKKYNEIPWGLLHEESPRNNPLLVQEQALNLFTYSSTFSRFSDVPLTLVDLPGLTELLSKNYFVSTKEKTRLINTKSLAPVLYIQSDCDTASNRDVYISELMKYIHIDSYGTCLNNVQLDKRLKDNYLEILNTEDFLSFIANYKFTIAFENAICYDYITEKLWRPLLVGSIPVYYGSPSFKDWLPNNMSAISVLDFKDPVSLANYLHYLSNNEVEYNKYLSHKLISNYIIDNYKLEDALQKRKKWFLNDFRYYVEEFECFVCTSIGRRRIAKIVDKKHYDCPLPTNPLTNKTDYKNWWTKEWLLHKCGAKILHYYLQNSLTITTESFEGEKMKLYDRNEC